MNVLGVFPTYRPSTYSGNVGGGEISNRILLEGLVENGCSVSVITLAGAGDRLRTINGVDVYDVGRSGSGFARLCSAAFFRKKVLSSAGSLKFDVIVTATEAVPASLYLGNRLGVPVGVIIRALENFDSRDSGVVSKAKRMIKSALFGDYGEKCLSKSSFFLPNSEFMRSLCKERFPNIPSRVVYPPVESEIYPVSIDYSVKTIVMVGTGYHKGTALTYKLAEAFPDLVFRIVGVPEVPVGSELQDHNIISVGWCDIEEEFRLRADLVIVPSICEEAFGRVAIEALCAGKLVLASEIGGLPEALGYEKDLLLPPDDFDAWKERIQNVLTFPGYYAQVCKRVSQGVGRFSYDNQVRVLYQSLVDFSKEA